MAEFLVNGLFLQGGVLLRNDLETILGEAGFALRLIKANTIKWRLSGVFGEAFGGALDVEAAF